MGTGHRGRSLLVWAVVAGLAAACAGSTAASLEGESILDAEIPGTANGRITTRSDATVVKLFDVTGDWTAVSVELARIVQEHGWTVTALNCVGTGNDVIAEKLVDGEWLLLESGAGGRGAGLIVSRGGVGDRTQGLAVGGRCPDALVRAAR